MDDSSPPAPPAEATERTITAFRVGGDSAYTLEPAARPREWMDATDNRFANRCLPLLMANQAGWAIVNHCEVQAIWDGTNGKDAIKLLVDPSLQPTPAVSHFGFGVLTWQLPYLFRTPPDFDLLVRGPTNFFIDGIAPMDGLVETGWATATFTMNWKFTRPHHRVRFAPGDPIAMIVPQRRGDLESFRPVLTPIETQPREDAGHTAWKISRGNFIKMLSEVTTPLAPSKSWERHYFQGTAPDGTGDDDHRSKLSLRPFVRGDGAAPSE